MTTPLWTQSGRYGFGGRIPSKDYRVEWNWLTMQRAITGFLSHSPPPWYRQQETKVSLSFYSKELSNSKTHSLCDNQNWLSLSLTLIDLLHVYIEKCKSRINMHVKVKTLKRKQSHDSHSYTFRKERTPTSIYLFSPDFKYYAASNWHHSLKLNTRLYWVL
jgi:hypothetical protein